MQGVYVGDGTVGHERWHTSRTSSGPENAEAANVSQKAIVIRLYRES